MLSVDRTRCSWTYKNQKVLKRKQWSTIYFTVRVTKIVINMLKTVCWIKQLISSPDMYWSNMKGKETYIIYMIKKRDEQIKNLSSAGHSEAVSDEVWKEPFNRSMLCIIDTIHKDCFRDIFLLVHSNFKRNEWCWISYLILLQSIEMFYNNILFIFKCT